MLTVGRIRIEVLPPSGPSWSQLCGAIWRCVKLYAYNFLIAIDQLGNALIGGDPQETVSSRAGKLTEKKVAWACYLCMALDKLDPRHCDTARNTQEGYDSIPKFWKRETSKWR